MGDASEPLFSPPAQFDLGRRHPIRPIADVLCPLSTPAKLGTVDDAFHVLDPGGKVIRREPMLDLDGCEPPVRVRYRAAPKFVAALGNTALVGRGVVVTASGTVIEDMLAPTALEKHGASERDGELRFDPQWFGAEALPVVWFDEPALLMTGPAEAAFGDWIINFGPRLALARAARLNFRVVVRHDPQHRTLELLEALGVPRDRILFHRAHKVSMFRKLYVPSWPNRDKGSPMAGLFDVYRDLPIRPPPERIRLYLSREGAMLRPMVNEPQVREIFVRAGFQVIDPAERSYEEVRRLFSAAVCLAGPYGSAFHNMVFCGQRLHNLALMPPQNPRHLTEIGVWHAEHGQSFSYLQGERLSSAPDDTRWTAPLDRVERAVSALSRALDAAA